VTVRQPPLAGLDDEALTRAAQAGNDLALRTLVARYLSVAQRAGRRWYLAGGDRDDVEQEALIGLCEAVRDYDPEQGASFRSFAELCVSRQVLTAVRGATRHKHRPLNRSVSLTRLPDDVVDLRPALAAVADPAEAVVDRVRIDDALASLSARLSPLERQVLALCLERRSYGEIGRRLGRPPKAVDNAVQRIKRKAGADLALPA
jgi:RNA polymerase sporulation-specific sigma factor